MNRRLGYIELCALVLSSILLGYSVPNEYRMLRFAEERLLARVANSKDSREMSTAEFILKRSSSSSSSSESKDAKPNEDKLSSSEAPDATQLRGSIPHVEPVGPAHESSTITSHASNLQIAWLMSFPNSGTSYTGELIRRISKTKTGSNYARENLGADGNALPVFPDQPAGPFYVNPQAHQDYNEPSDYIFTKTHCGGYCERCGPSKYTETTYSFRNRCLASKWGATLDDGTETILRGNYPPDRVVKAVHLIRAPWDNIVSRFHLERHEKLDGMLSREYENSRQGFRDFCSNLNQQHAQEERGAVWLEKNKALDQMTADIPCRADFFRYVEWHNLAFVTARDMELETYILHYESYETRFDETVDELLGFLHLEKRGDAAAFKVGKTYKEYLTDDERARLKVAMQWMASPVLWKQLSHYFED